MSLIEPCAAQASLICLNSAVRRGEHWKGQRLLAGNTWRMAGRTMAAASLSGSKLRRVSVRIDGETNGDR